MRDFNSETDKDMTNTDSWTKLGYVPYPYNPHECWEELAEHSLTHDPLPHPETVPTT